MRLSFWIPIDYWLSQALLYPDVQLLPLSPAVAVKATQLPGNFHRGPADQIIVATAIVYQSILVTGDEAIRAYPHVQVAPKI